MTMRSTPEELARAAEAYMRHVQALACDHDVVAGTHTGCSEALALQSALESQPAPQPDVERLIDGILELRPVGYWSASERSSYRSASLDGGTPFLGPNVVRLTDVCRYLRAALAEPKP